jgi:glutathione-regulated potassium-efflux system ancillary protein KefF
MRFLPPLVFHGAHAAPAEDIAQHAELFGNRLATYPGWPELNDLPENETCVVPPTDRPVEKAGAPR